MKWHRTDPNIITSDDKLFKIARKPQNGVSVFMLGKWDGAEGRYKHIRTAYNEDDLKLDAEELEFIE